MNEEELQWLKEISTRTGVSYSGDRTITTDFADKLIDYIKELEQLQNNWNELKEWAEERIKNANEYLNDPDKNWDEDANGYVLARKFQSEETLKKMQELEQGKDE